MNYSEFKKWEKQFLLTDQMRQIRQFNHAMVDELNKIRSIKNKTILDLGASYYGFALERALKLGADYVGIDSDIKNELVVHHHNRCGKIFKMNAEKLDFGDNQFDLIMTLSTFEHFSNIKKVLSEMYRVIKQNGEVLITFSPVWTCSYGHHLHQWLKKNDVIPPYSHLFLNEYQFYKMALKQLHGDEKTAQMYTNWTYKSKAINRLTLQNIKDELLDSKFTIVWQVELNDQTNAETANYVSSLTGICTKDLITRGLSLLLKKN